MDRSEQWPRAKAFYSNMNVQLEAMEGRGASRGG